MPFTDRQILAVADSFETLSRRSRHGSLYTACAAALRVWPAHREFYAKTLTVARRFLHELEDHVRDILNKGGVTADDQETAFALFECLACVIREAGLNRGGPTPDEERVLDYFVSCGEWRPDDSTLAAEYFFRRIPAAVPRREDAASAGAFSL